MTALYNEIDPDAAHVLRALIADGVIAPGIVDTRSIKDLTPDDLAGFTQVHLFAGGGLWSVAARMAGWPDDRPLWSASCPCQPFSAAGKGLGTDDPRHLWPDVDRLVRGCRERGFGPPVLVGEQVAGAPGYHWFDGVRSDLALQGYGARVVDIPACAVDAPHIRQRLYWVARQMADASHVGGARPWQGREGVRPRERETGPVAAADGGSLDVADADARRRAGRPEDAQRGSFRRDADERPAARNGSFWSDAEWLACHDGKARRTKPGLRLLVDGLPGRVGLWRLAGNAIVAPLAAEVLGALLDAERDAERFRLMGAFA
jgi:DNA (cytosine-5)-methyltransferase 1